MMISKPLCLFTFITLISNSALAADADGNYAIWGPGRSSCNQFNQAYEKDEITAHKGFLMGYLTAYNMLTKDTYKATGSDSLSDSLGRLNGYCNDNKMDSFERAIKVLLASLHDKRQRGMPGRTRGWGRPGMAPNP